MIRMCQIQHCVTQQHQQLFVLSSEQTSQRLLAGFHHHTFSDPLPKLFLCRPKLFPVAANDECRLLLTFLFAHFEYTSALACGRTDHTHSTPWGSLSCEAALSCQSDRRTLTPAISQVLRIRRVFDSATIGSEYARLVSVVTLRNSLSNINVSESTTATHVGEAPRNPKDPN